MIARKIKVSVGVIVVMVKLNDSSTAKALWDSLPISGNANIWGDEIYFSIPIYQEEEQDSQKTVQIGDVAYWPPGRAMCLFWGQTPVSAPGEVRPASAVNVIGVIDGDPTVLNNVSDGSEITVERVIE